MPARPLPSRRIALTRPPAGWFHGISRTIFEIYRESFAALGLAAFELPLDAFEPPAIAFGISHGLHALSYRGKSVSVGRAPRT